MAGGGFGYASGVSPYVPAPVPVPGAIPVPAPIPVPEYEAAWYFRADFAAGFGSQPSVTALGTPFGSTSAPNSVTLSPDWLSKSFEPAFTGGVGVGYVWGPSFRTDLTVDIHSIMNANYQATTTDGAGVPISIQDKTKFMSTILLMNGYYDIRTDTPFTPYIGGGVGFAVNQLTQEAAQNNLTNGSNISASGRTTHIGFAAAAMVGLNYDINTFVSLDVGYRYLFITGSDVDIPFNGANSKIEVGGINEHQIRAGLRFYVN
jgi:opacity protein-like surface antigen